MNPIQRHVNELLSLAQRLSVSLCRALTAICRALTAMMQSANNAFSNNILSSYKSYSHNSTFAAQVLGVRAENHARHATHGWPRGGNNSGVELAASHRARSLSRDAARLTSVHNERVPVHGRRTKEVCLRRLRTHTAACPRPFPKRTAAAADQTCPLSPAWRSAPPDSRSRPGVASARTRTSATTAARARARGHGRARARWSTRRAYGFTRRSLVGSRSGRSKTACGLPPGHPPSPGVPHSGA